MRAFLMLLLAPRAAAACLARAVNVTGAGGVCYESDFGGGEVRSHIGGELSHVMFGLSSVRFGLCQVMFGLCSVLFSLAYMTVAYGQRSLELGSVQSYARLSRNCSRIAVMATFPETCVAPTFSLHCCIQSSLYIITLHTLLNDIYVWNLKPLKI